MGMSTSVSMSMSLSVNVGMHVSMCVSMSISMLVSMGVYPQRSNANMGHVAPATCVQVAALHA